MTTSEGKHPKEYWAFKLGQQLADLRVRFEDAWNPFFPGDAFDPGSIGLQQKLRPVEFYDDLDLKVGEIRKTLKELTTRGPKVKKVALDALTSLDGVVYKIEEGIDDQKLDDDPELKNTIHKLLASILKEESVRLVDQSNVLLRPLIVNIMGEVYENHRKQEEIISGLLETSSHADMSVPDTYAAVDLGILPIFDRPKWKQFTERLRKTALSMGENSGVAFEVAIELELARYHFHIDNKSPYESWSFHRQLQYVTERTNDGIDKLTKAGFDIESVDLDSKNVPPGTAAEYASAEIIRRLKQEDAFTSGHLLTESGDASIGVYEQFSPVGWNDVVLILTYEAAGGCTLSVHSVGDRELPTVSKDVSYWGFAKQQDPRSLTKQWYCLVLLTAGNQRAQFVERDDGRLGVDLEELTGNAAKLVEQVKSHLPVTKEAIKKQMKELGHRLSRLMAIPGSPISLKRKAPPNRVLWTIECEVELVIESPS
jgi:hypothetical protein